MDSHHISDSDFMPSYVANKGAPRKLPDSLAHRAFFAIDNQQIPCDFLKHDLGEDSCRCHRKSAC